MKRRTQQIILTVLLVIFCLCIFASCKANEKIDYFAYSESNLGVMGKLVKLMHGWIGNYGWTVVVFTVFLKIVMIPLDMWQRISSRKSSLKMQKMQPLMQEIDKRYGANSQRANEEKQKLYKKQGFSGLSMCLPMIISMVIFFVMFGGLNDYSRYSSWANFQKLSNTYFDSYFAEVEQEGGEKWQYLKQEYDIAFDGSAEKNEYKRQITAQSVSIGHFEEEFGNAESKKFRDAALEKVGKTYEENHESWLWIQNVWQPDTWASIMPPYEEQASIFRTSSFSSIVDMSAFGGKGAGHYELIRSAVLKTGVRGDAGKWNGLMLLPIFSIGLSFLSIFVTQRLDRRRRSGEKAPEQNAQQAATNKVMMIMMPLMMAFFGFMYTGAFAIYMVCNYLLSIVSTLALHVPVEKIVQKSLAKMEQKEKSNKASYMR